MFSESSPCLLGQHGSCSSTVKGTGELSENILQNLRNDLPSQTVVILENGLFIIIGLVGILVACLLPASRMSHGRFSALDADILEARV